MIGRKSIVGLCMLCALAISAFAAQSASAVFTGTTAFTCKEVATGGAGTKGFKDAHCKEKAEGAAVKYEHVEIANDTTTDIKATNETTGGETKSFTLKTTVAGTNIELTSEIVHVEEASLHNHLTGEEHQATGSIGKITFTNVTVKNPAGCQVKDDIAGGMLGMVTSNKLKFTTAGQGMAIKYEPEEAGKPFASFIIEDAGGGLCPAIVKGTKEVFGSIKSTSISGATTEFTHEDTTTQGTLRFGAPTGPKAGITGTFTTVGRHHLKPEEAFTPISLTTTGEA